MKADHTEKVAKFFSQYKLQYFDKGQIFIQPGEDPAGIYYLVKGQVEQFDISVRGDDIVVNVFKPPSFFPMSWAINGTPNTYFFRAKDKVLYRLAPAEATVEFLQNNPDVTFDLLARVYRGTDGMLGRMAQLMGGSARNRLLYELIVESQRFGEQRKDGISLALTETELAARMGLTRETVSRELGAIKKAGLIKISEHRIIVKDINQLQAKLQLK